jgi:hypothetical protein
MLAPAAARLENLTLTPIFPQDVRTSPIFAGKPSLNVMLDAGSLSVVSMPIVSRASGVLGMLSPHRRSVGRPKPAELNRLEWLARQAAEILEGSGSPFSIRSVEIVARGRNPASCRGSTR